MASSFVRPPVPRVLSGVRAGGQFVFPNAAKAGYHLMVQYVSGRNGASDSTPISAARFAGEQATLDSNVGGGAWGLTAAAHGYCTADGDVVLDYTGWYNIGSLHVTYSKKPVSHFASGVGNLWNTTVASFNMTIPSPGVGMVLLNSSQTTWSRANGSTIFGGRPAAASSVVAAPSWTPSMSPHELGGHQFIVSVYSEGT